MPPIGPPNKYQPASHSRSSDPDGQNQSPSDKGRWAPGMGATTSFCRGINWRLGPAGRDRPLPTPLTWKDDQVAAPTPRTAAAAARTIPDGPQHRLNRKCKEQVQGSSRKQNKSRERKLYWDPERVKEESGLAHAFPQRDLLTEELGRIPRE